jgi:hypothetical protein
VFYGVDVEGVRRFFREANAVVADAEPQLAGVALQLLDVALARLREAVESREDAHCRIAVDLADISACRKGKDNSLHAGFRQRLRSSPEWPNSARMSSWGMPSPGCCAIQAFEAATA